MKNICHIKMNNKAEEPPDDLNPSKNYIRDAKPKVKPLCNNVNELHPEISNGRILHSEEISSANCNSSMLVSLSSSSSSSSAAPPPPSPSPSPSPLPSQSSYSHLYKLSVDKQNGECSGEMCSVKMRTLNSDENDLVNCDKKRKTGCCLDSESSSGNEAEEGLSSDDCCIYTYKGDQFADLPNSFFSVDMTVNGKNQILKENHRKAYHRREVEDADRNNLASSPEMDYLEMDFDPGPSLEQDSEEDVMGFESKPNDSPVPELPSEFLYNEPQGEEINKLSAKETRFQNLEVFQPGPSDTNRFDSSVKNSTAVSDCNSNDFNRTKKFLSNCCADISTVNKFEDSDKAGSQENNDETLKLGNIEPINSIFDGKEIRNTVLSPVKIDTSTSDNDIDDDSKTFFDGIMMWSEQEAVLKQVTLVSSDVSCAATAVINAMMVLKMQITIEKVGQSFSTKLKTNSSSIPQYLVSRSYAGVAHENLIRGIHHASNGILYARFFQMYPKRDIPLAKWLGQWMKKGAVPIATMNVQRELNPEDSSFDLRHHQMIFGVNSKGIYLTNPLECVQEEELLSRLVSPSVLKIKRSEILSRWRPDCNLKPLMFQTDGRWKEMNVLGQVVNIIRESSELGGNGKNVAQHILIPASSGITLVIPRHFPAYEELASTADLPLSINSD